jgi:hypothetical protein
MAPTSWCGGRRASTPRRTKLSRKSSLLSSRKRGKQVALALLPLTDIPDAIQAALEAGQPPDFAFGLLL